MDIYFVAYKFFFFFDFFVVFFFVLFVFRPLALFNYKYPICYGVCPSFPWSWLSERQLLSAWH